VGARGCEGMRLARGEEGCFPFSLAYDEGSMKRDEVYLAIDEERDYQDRKRGLLPATNHEVGAWIEVIRGELEEAAQAWRKKHPDDTDALRELVQVAATCVKCLEQHGAPGRDE
jgi:hypothetical protein